ncbi:MAG: efflux RND transporter periplasmic adaptor subunit [Geminicoccales bacterium]
MKRLIILVFVSLLLAVLVGGFAYFQFVVKPEMIKGFITAAGQPPVTVATEPAKVETWVTKLPAIGTLRAVQGVEVASEVGGIVRAINFDSGELVREGTVLVQLDDSVEQADLKSGLAQLKKAELELERQRELLRRNNTSKTNFDAALAARDTAAATVDRVRAVIAQKAITSAFDGRLGIRHVDLGQYVSPGAAMVTLQQVTPIYVDFPMPEQNLSMLAVGATVEVAVDAEPDRVFEGRIESIDARVNQATRNVLVRARVDNTEARLLPGMFANVNVIAGEPRQVVTLPRTAVTYSLYGDSVYIVVAAPAAGEKPGAPIAGAESGGARAEETPEKDGRGEPQLMVDRRFVRVGEARGDRVAILEGVKPGEQVVVAGQLKLQPQARVRIDNSTPLTAPAERPLE